MQALPATGGTLGQGELAAFAARDWLRGKRLVEPLPGTAEGIEADGSLRVRDAHGVIRLARSGHLVLGTSGPAPDGVGYRTLHASPLTSYGSRLTSHVSRSISMLLALDIGNSEITIGLFRGETLDGHWRLTTNPERTSDEWGAVLGSFLVQAGHSPNEVRACCLASVAPQVTQAIRAGVESVTGVGPVEVTARSPLPLTLDVDEPFAVGADRVVNALAAFTIFRTDAVVVDFGTATTFDCVTADGRFLGGAIMPGLRTSADQLTRRAAKLPATDLLPPERAIARRTDDAIRAGVLYGTADAVDGMIARIRKEWPGGGKPMVIATGGLAPSVAPHSTSIQEVDPDLTLRGVRIAARHLGLTW